MLLGIIKNKDNSIEYLDIINNRIYATHLDKDGFKCSDTNYIKTILKKLLFNDKCIYLKDYKDHKVYFDKETKLKHFMKDDKENLKLFYLFNGQDNILYEESLNNNHKITSLVKKFTIGLAGCAVIINFGAILIENSIKEPSLATYDFDLNSAIESIYSEEEISQMYDNGKITYKDAIDYIYNSNLDDETKNFLANEEILKDIFSYYKGTPLEYSANLKFNGINIKYKTIEKKGTLGSYNHLEQSTIYISDIFSENPDSNEYNDYIINKGIYYKEDIKKGVIGHEYFHLLQAEGSPWHYIEEASAELLSHEYFNSNIISYYNGIKNLKLLIEIIGPEPIMKMLFAGNDDELNNILKNNLSEEDSTKLISYFQDSSIIDDHYKENTEIRELLCNLYKNLYGKDISEDANILYDLRYANYKFDNNDPFLYEPRWYLNIHKMSEKEPYPVFDLDVKELIDNGIIVEEKIALYQKEISIDEYHNLKQENTNKYNIGFDVLNKKGRIEVNEITNESNYIDEFGNKYSIEEAVNNENISINIRQTVEEDSQIIKQIEKEGWTKVSQSIQYSSKFSTIDATNPEILVISTESVGTRNNFSNQIKNMNEQANSKSSPKRHNI